MVLPLRQDLSPKSGEPEDSAWIWGSDDEVCSKLNNTIERNPLLTLCEARKAKPPNARKSQEGT